MRFIFLIVFILVYSFQIKAQTNKCKVLLENISENYQGECVDGLANGKGKASGIDSYKGFFKGGLPDGTGTYTYRNGDIYKGEWQAGLKHGKGEFRYTLNNKTSKLIGFWNKGEYSGTTKPDNKYRVITTTGITQYTVEEKESNQKVIRLIMKNNMTDFMPTDLNLGSSSGQISQVGKRMIISDYICPYTLDVSYTIRTGSGIRKNFRFGIQIDKPGYFVITLIND